MNILKYLERRLALPGDSETRRSQKAISIALLFLGGFISVMSVFTFLGQGLETAGRIYALWACFILSVGVLILAVPRLWLPAFSVALIAILPTTLGIHVYSGGFQGGMENIVVLMQTPIAASLFIGMRFTVVSMALYALTVIAATLLEPYAQSVAPEVALSSRMQAAAINLTMIGLMATAAGLYLVRQVDYFRKRADDLLLNVLPAPVVARLKESPETIAESHSAVSVLFADVVGSTPLFSQLEPAAAVEWLNQVFTMFDRLAAAHQLEKIRTIGDGYMVAAGAPIARSDHAQALAAFALEMVRGLEGMPAHGGERLAFRVGMHSGPVIGGVIGRARVHYDLWGDTVNVASRMESHGEAGKIQISRATYELIKDEFECVSRGLMPIKGKGEMETWFLVGRKDGIGAG